MTACLICPLLLLLLPFVANIGGCRRFVDCWLLIASATFFQQLLGVGHMAQLPTPHNHNSPLVHVLLSLII
jgi:hypothetical protein